MDIETEGAGSIDLLSQTITYLNLVIFGKITLFATVGSCLTLGF